MKEKKITCKYCEGKMEAKTTRQEFCSDKCRVYWNRENPKVKVVNLNENTHTASNKTKSAPKTNFTVNTTKNANNGLNRPVRLEGEDAIEFAFRLNSWKKSQ